MLTEMGLALVAASIDDGQILLDDIDTLGDLSEYV